jgi:hypothetical protein
MSCKSSFRIMIPGRIDCFVFLGFGKLFHEDLFFRGNRTERLDDGLPVNIEEFPALFDQRLKGIIYVTFIGKLMEDIKNTGCCPELGIPGETKLLCDFIGGDESNAEDIRG